MNIKKLKLILETYLDQIGYEINKIKNEFLDGTRDCGSFASQHAYLLGRLDGIKNIIELINKENKDE